MRKTTLILLFSALLSSTAIAGMSDSDKSKAWECSGIYMANYFLPSGETFEYSMKEKSMASVKVLKAYDLRTLTDAIDFSFILYSKVSPDGKK